MYKPNFVKHFNFQHKTTWGMADTGETFAKLSQEGNLYWRNQLPVVMPDKKSKTQPTFRKITRVPHRRITSAIRETGEYLDSGLIFQHDAEMLLDLLYAELQRRVDRGVIGRDNQESEE